MTNVKLEEDLLESKDTREELMDKVEVLEKVKELILLPNTELMTTRMVSEWYEVSQEAIRKITQRNKEELTENGMMFKKHSEIKRLITPYNIADCAISPRGSNVFDANSIILISFLLRKSAVAKQVREEVVKHKCLTNEFKEGIIKLDNSYLKENGVYIHLCEVFDELFRIEREVECGDYFIDIVITKDTKKLAIEIDEFGHKPYDKLEEIEREEYMKRRGYKIIRFNPDCKENNNILRLVNKILTVINR